MLPSPHPSTHPKAFLIVVRGYFSRTGGERGSTRLIASRTYFWTRGGKGGAQIIRKHFLFCPYMERKENCASTCGTHILHCRVQDYARVYSSVDPYEKFHKTRKMPGRNFSLLLRSVVVLPSVAFSGIFPLSGRRGLNAAMFVAHETGYEGPGVSGGAHLPLARPRQQDRPECGRRDRGNPNKFLFLLLPSIYPTASFPEKSNYRPRRSRDSGKWSELQLLIHFRPYPRSFTFPPSVH